MADSYRQADIVLDTELLIERAVSVGDVAARKPGLSYDFCWIHTRPLQLFYGVVLSVVSGINFDFGVLTLQRNQSSRIHYVVRG